MAKTLLQGLKIRLVGPGSAGPRTKRDAAVSVGDAVASTEHSLPNAALPSVLAAEMLADGLDTCRRYVRIEVCRGVQRPVRYDKMTRGGAVR